MQKLILWDIDGTLLYTGGVSGRAMRAAMARIYGQSPSDERAHYAGKTDRQIIFETFVDRDQAELLGLIDHFVAAYLEELDINRAELLARVQVFDGVVPVLERLQHEAVIQTALTGNLQQVARLKLEVTGLLKYFDIEVGAYGSDHHERTQLPAIAAARASERYGRSFAGSDLVVIGDTPNDIACGRAGGARTVAIATGPFSVEALRECRPDAVLPSLADTDAAIKAILG